MLGSMFQSEFEHILLSDDNAHWNVAQAVLLWDWCNEQFEDLLIGGGSVEEFVDACRNLTCKVVLRCSWHGYTDPQEYYTQHYQYNSDLPDPMEYADDEEWQSAMMDYLTENKIILWDGVVGSDFVVSAE